MGIGAIFRLQRIDKVDQIVGGCRRIEGAVGAGGDRNNYSGFPAGKQKSW
jgi:hypothetical protein